MPTKHTKNTKPVTAGTVDPTRAKAAFTELEKVYADLPADRLLSARVDPQLAAAHAFGIAERDSAPDRAAAFEKLAAAHVFGAKPNDRLRQAALGVWFARQQQQRVASQGESLLSSPTTTAADAVKRRMLKVATHYLEDHPTYGPELLAIRAGTGYQDTANDLQQLADLYDAADVKPVVSKDPTHYRATDVADARKYAGQIFKALGFDSAEAAEWNNHVQRAYTYLDDVYTEHCRAGGLLFFRSEDVDVTYPMSLVSVVRAPRGRSEQAPADGAPSAARPAPTPAGT